MKIRQVHSDTKSQVIKMSLSNCRHCGKLFMMQRSAYCPGCQGEYDRHYMQVRDYLLHNPHSTMLDVHQHTGIPLPTLLEIRKETFVPFAN